MGTEDITLSAAYRSISVTFKSLVRKNKEIHRLLNEAERIASSTVNCLLLGETGTGKNLIAQAIHNASPRVGGPFVSLNCSAIPDTLIESELFGAEAGAFTDSVKRRKGLFEQADGGTLFLDEIGDLSISAQAKILHAIEYKEFSRVGGEERLNSDVRVLAATNQPMKQQVDRGEFRQDLYFRLNEYVVEIPPLRNRREDIQPLAMHFIAECNEKFDRRIRKIDKPTMELLKRYNWPGNVRELRGVIKRGVARCQGDVLTLDDLQLKMDLVETSSQQTSEAEDLALETVERKHIKRVMMYTNWVKAEAARLLGISRPTLDRKLNQYEISRREE